jgi:hypothetical protein
MNRSSRRGLLCGAVLLFLLTACREKSLFERVRASESGLRFVNQITENDSINVLDFEYLFNGGGVGVGDFNNDGLPDLFFSGSQVPGKLFLNRGNLRFDDITVPAGIQTPYWSTGVSVVDINTDGLPDIYLCTVHPRRGESAPNQLFINQGPDAQGIPHFREEAAAYGLDDRGYSTQAAFFDYDRDGDLDCYLLTNALEAYSRNQPRGQSQDGLGRSTDRLYRNDSGPPRGRQVVSREGVSRDPIPQLTNARRTAYDLKFTNVSREAGITHEGWGLGVVVGDFNHDGWPDVYCANDFQSSDLLWINNGDSSGRHAGFTNRIGAYMKHGSFNAMGVDLADLNNDGWPELMTLDMMPDDNRRQKSMFASQPYDRYELSMAMKYEPQFVRNVLQLNRGPRPGPHPSEGGVGVVFSEVGQQVGLHATDWSWSPLFADFDNDGWRDVLITNGYPKDVTDLDFITYTNQFRQSYFKRDTAAEQKNKESLLKLIGVKKSNWAFRNALGVTTPGTPGADRSLLAFDDVTEAWGLRLDSYSNGAVYADLDNDGDLDLVINALNDDPLLYRNTLNDRPGTEARPRPHYLRLGLRGTGANPQGFGARVEVVAGGLRQTIEHTPYRGYVSTVEPALHFGLGTAGRVDTLRVTWPDGRITQRTHLPADQRLTLRQEEAGPAPPAPAPVPVRAVFTEHAPARTGLTVRHEESAFVDFKQQVLLPHLYSRNGPGIAVGDVDGDGLDDLYVGGASESPGTLYRQVRAGVFESTPLPKHDDKNWGDDLGALFFDADGDGDSDLYVAVGGNEFAADHPRYEDRLYLNDGRGTFTLAPAGTLPGTRGSGSCVIAADYDRDGDLDLFIGGRLDPRRYPEPGRCYLLRNDGPLTTPGRAADRLRFTDVTPEALRTPGMVGTALWTDADADGWVDLLLAGEWMAPTLFRNERGTFPSPPRALVAERGWWNSLAAGDFDHDGDTDYLIGNLGLNNRYGVTPERPLELFAKDFDQNGTVDPILSYYIQGRSHPAAPRDQLADHIPGLKKKFTSYAQYGEMVRKDLIGDDVLQDARHFSTNQLASGYLENRGNGTFAFRTLPALAQIAPVYGIQVGDFDADGHLDALLVGNFYPTDVLVGRYDAGKGLLLRGDGRGGFAPVSVAQAGLLADRDARALARVGTGGAGYLLVVSNNHDTLQAFRPTAVRGTPLRLHPDDATALLVRADGRRQRVEFGYGTGYLSQSSRTWLIPPGTHRVLLQTYRGHRRLIRLGQTSTPLSPTPSASR